jgi:transposase-like protein
MAYSRDFIERAVAYKNEGHTFQQLREAFDIPPNTYYNWSKRLANGYYDTKIKQDAGGKSTKKR